ncbi:MAG: nitroreductase family protein [Tannerella sp.]|nr:nitroreductase family protein [Tannerella sp.]
MNEVIKCMLNCRTIRKYLPKQITDEELDTILSAGLYAPNAGGRQSTVIVVCQKSEINETLGKINKAAFRGSVSTDKFYISKDQPSIADDTSIQSGFYGAPTVLTLFAPKNFLYSAADCFVAAQNIVLAAYSVGIGSCIVARAEDTFSSDVGQKLQNEWGIDNSLEAKIHITLGYVDGDYPQAKPRKENRIKRVI